MVVVSTVLALLMSVAVSSSSALSVDPVTTAAALASATVSDSLQLTQVFDPAVRPVMPLYTGLGIADPSIADRALNERRPINDALGERLRQVRMLSERAVDDTVRKPRRKAFEYSDAYHTRLEIHKWLSWTMLPLFAASYVTGDELLKANAAGRTPKDWARTWHAPAASATAVLFGANTITGAWNLYEGWGDPNGRKRRILHSVLFMAASGGFAYTGTQLADEAQQSQHMREQHRNMALASMGVSTISWLIMLIGN